MYVYRNLLARALCFLCISACSVPVFASGGGGYVNLGGLYTIAGTDYNMAFSSVQDSANTPPEQPLNAVSTFGNVKLKSFDGMGGFASIGYHVGGQFIIEAELSMYYRDDYLTKKQEEGTLVVENTFISGFVNVGYEMSFGKARPYVAGGFGVINRDMDGSYEVTVDKVFDDTTPQSLTGGVSRLYFSDVSESFFGYQIRAGAIVMIGGDEKQGIMVGYRYTGAKDINIKRDDVTDLAIDFPTTTASGTGMASRPIQESDAQPPYSPSERYYIKKLEYGTHFLEFAIRLSF